VNGYMPPNMNKIKLYINGYLAQVSGCGSQYRYVSDKNSVSRGRGVHCFSFVKEFIMMPVQVWLVRQGV